MEPSRLEDQVQRILRASSKLTKREAQLQLLHMILDEPSLLSSNILSSIAPKIGKKFAYHDLELKKTKILVEARERILKECSIVEANRDILKIGKQLRPLTDKSSTETLQRLQNNTEAVRKQCRKQHDKKILFFNSRLSTSAQPARTTSNERRGSWRKKRSEKRKEGRKRHRENRKRKKQEWLKNKVKGISTSVVRNLSSLEAPDEAFLYLAKGLNFVESKEMNKEDLKYDTQEFLRKLEWRAFFHEKKLEESLDSEISFDQEEHPDLRIPSRKHPEGYHSPLFEEVKTKLTGYANSFVPTKPSSNLTHYEKQGKSWVIKNIKNGNLFITEADKGGATLILDFSTAIDCVTRALNNQENFVKADCTVDEKMTRVKEVVQESVLAAVETGGITEKDKTLITGLNQNNNMKQSPVFRPAVPYVYPLFKIHKLSAEQIDQKTTPPIRLVHATKQGPLYRLEKWLSPYLTEISRPYCGSEFVLDTPDLLKHIKELNTSGSIEQLGRGVNLFTLDVIALYPSIKPETAMTALEHALSEGASVQDTIKTETLYAFTKVILSNSFVTFQNGVYTGKKGIPTGNCISRQIADITLHWLLILNLLPKMNVEQMIAFWRRYIDDILGLWRGTRRQFDLFVANLNIAAQPFGIQFGDTQFGKTVNYLDVELSLGNDNQIEYKLYKKDTDARLYLKTDSFHPEHVFRSTIFAQMIRVIQRNSTDSTCVKDLAELKQDLSNSGHTLKRLEDTEPRAAARAINNELYSDTQSQSNSSQLVFSVRYFQEVKDLKKLVHSVKEDIHHLIGDTQITFALRKSPSIRNTVVRNRRLSDPPEPLNDQNYISQSCNGKGCLTCPLMFSSNETILVNGKELNLDFSLNCKDKYIIYFARCEVCSNKSNDFNEVGYFGQTMTPLHIRMNGHRSKFKINPQCDFEKSALSMHCFLKHKDEFSLNFFKIGIVKKVKPNELDREEDKLINRFRTNIWGLNRIVVVR